MEKKFKSTKHILFQVILVGMPMLLLCGLMILLLPTIWSAQTVLLMKILLVGLMLVVTYLLWKFSSSFQNTTYTIDGDKIRYECGMNRGEIPITQIRSIEQSRYPAAGNRPALDFNGLQIVYGEGYSIFISPESKEEFMKLLRDKYEVLSNR